MNLSVNLVSFPLGFSNSVLSDKNSIITITLYSRLKKRRNIQQFVLLLVLAFRVVRSAVATRLDFCGKISENYYIDYFSIMFVAMCLRTKFNQPLPLVLSLGSSIPLRSPLLQMFSVALAAVSFPLGVAIESASIFAH